MEMQINGISASCTATLANVIYDTHEKCMQSIHGVTNLSHFEIL